MTNEERDIITRFIARVSGAEQGNSGFGSTPSTRPALPAVDRDAAELITQEFGRHPEAPYRITQMAFVQEAALAEAQNRIQRLQWELQQMQQQQQATADRPAGRGGLFGGLFGGGNSPRPNGPQYGMAPPPPPPQYAPGMAQPGMFQQGGSGFLGSALTTAAGVAGGMVAGNALMGLFSGHHGGGSDFAGGTADTPDPWGGAGVSTPAGDGYWSKDDAYQPGSGGGDPGWGDAGQSVTQSDPGWNDPPTESGSGWDDAGSSDDQGGW